MTMLEEPDLTTRVFDDLAPSTGRRTRFDRAWQWLTASKAGRPVTLRCQGGFLRAALVLKDHVDRPPTQIGDREALFRACNEHLRDAVRILKPEWLIGVGDFAMKRALEIFPEGSIKIGRILHPSPASPAANRDWPGAATRQLLEQGVWKK